MLSRKEMATTVLHLALALAACQGMYSILSNSYGIQLNFNLLSAFSMFGTYGLLKLVNNILFKRTKNKNDVIGIHTETLPLEVYTYTPRHVYYKRAILAALAQVGVLIFCQRVLHKPFVVTLSAEAFIITVLFVLIIADKLFFEGIVPRIARGME